MKRLAAILLTCACGGEYSVAAPADDGGFLESRGEAGEEAATQDTATVDAPTCGASARCIVARLPVVSPAPMNSVGVLIACVSAIE